MKKVQQDLPRVTHHQAATFNLVTLFCCHCWMLLPAFYISLVLAFHYLIFATTAY
jgi:hypothetical protein